MRNEQSSANAPWLVPRRYPTLPEKPAFRLQVAATEYLDLTIEEAQAAVDAGKLPVFYEAGCAFVLREDLDRLLDQQHEARIKAGLPPRQPHDPRALAALIREPHDGFGY